MVFCKYILIFFVLFVNLREFVATDVTGFQEVQFRNNDRIQNMTVVLRNIPRHSIRARLYFKKYSSTFPYGSVNVRDRTAVFENIDVALGRNVEGRELYSSIILLNDTEYGDTIIMKLKYIGYADETENENRKVPHACLQTCRIIIDYNDTPSSTTIRGVTHENSSKDENSISVAPSQVSSGNKVTSPDWFPNLNVRIYPNTSIVYKPNSTHRISCVVHNLEFNYTIRLYQKKNEEYNIRATTTSSELSDELVLTEADDGTSLQCYIIWMNHVATTKMIDLILNRVTHENSSKDENSISVVPSQVTSGNKESYWKNISLITATMVIIILLLIIILLGIRVSRSRSQRTLGSDDMSQSAVNFKNLIQKYNKRNKSDDVKVLQNNLELWKNEEGNENIYDNNYYCYAVQNEISGTYCNEENKYYDIYENN